ncbi:MAG: phosphomannomutase/phosphoglucomutase [Patescibacteria group bacterium]|nr:phosphomannomutase/phosphoglucomutase [Patescibacteria group bacterium]MDD5164689.1 phosphomannomutase/phosphoglucomutase [Patescibacteria group bacterium]MDD5534989.1 phosphomannomutase/phosphoglucomutase [Patescibacteria group bacterium]
MSSINQKIFLAYDIRGIYPKDFNEDAAYKIGRAFVDFLCSKFQIPNSKFKVVVGRDCRLAAPKIFKSFSKGVIDQGANVIDIGKVPVDALYFALHYFKTDASAMITASHNPPEYIGIKMMAKDSKCLCADWGIPQIKELALKNQFIKAKHHGKVIKKDIVPHYLKYILNLEDISSIKPLKVVVDASNGMAGKIVKSLAKKLPIKLTCLYCNQDGSFLNHPSNPLLPESTRDLQKEVIKQKADFGLIYDGDGDRTIFIDEKGQAVSGDMLIILFASYFLKKEQGATIGYNLICSKSVPEIIREMGGKPLRTKTGQSLVKEIAKKHQAIFTGEISGHICFRDTFYVECGGLILLLMLKILSATKTPLSQIINNFKRYYRLGEINFEVKNSQAIIKKIAEIYKDGKQDWLDGLTVDYWSSPAVKGGTSWWFNIRPSNTEPLLRLVIEAENKEKAEEEFKKISRIIKTA